MNESEVWIHRKVDETLLEHEHLRQQRSNMGGHQRLDFYPPAL